MGKTYSQDLRTRVHQHIGEGHSRHNAGRRFGVRASTAIRLEARYRVRQAISRRARQCRPPDQGKLAPYLGFLTEIVDSVQAITLLELAEALASEHEITVHQSSILRALQPRKSSVASDHSTVVFPFIPTS